MYETIALAHQDAVSIIRLVRPPFNLVTVEMLDEIDRAFDEIEARAEACAVIFTGTGERAFCAGADIKAGEVSSDDCTGQGPAGQGPRHPRAHGDLPQAHRRSRARLVHRR